MDLPAVVAAAAELQPIEASAEVQAQVGTVKAYDSFAAQSKASAHYRKVPVKLLNPTPCCQAVDFIVRRLEQILVDGGVSIEAVRAALSERSANPCLAAATARDLQVRPP